MQEKISIKDNIIKYDKSTLNKYIEKIRKLLIKNNVCIL
jgi:hypothetical protein